MPSGYNLMKPRPQQVIQQMRAEARAQTPAHEGKLHYLCPSDGNSPMKIHIRKLHVGEQRKVGDLWLDETGRLIPLGLRPWWKRLSGYGPVLDTHADHFRILP